VRLWYVSCIAGRNGASSFCYNTGDEWMSAHRDDAVG
jgi:hypothetical protein